VGAIIGIALIKRGGRTHWRTLGGITSGWVVTPIIAGLISFFSLFFLQNVFQQQTYRPTPYALTSYAFDRIKKADLPFHQLEELKIKKFSNAVKFERALSNLGLSHKERKFIVESSEIDPLKVTNEAISKLSSDWFTSEQKESLKKLENKVFLHKWQFTEILPQLSSQWQFIKNDRKHNQDLQNKLSYLFSLFRVEKEFNIN